MIPPIESLVDAFETRRLSRRELVASLAALVATWAVSRSRFAPRTRMFPTWFCAIPASARPIRS